MQPVRTNRIADSADFAREFGVSRETVDRLEVYATLLTKWQKTINLVAPSTLGEVWHRHFSDSAQVVGVALARTMRGGLLIDDPDMSADDKRKEEDAFVNEPHHWLDLGSGAGFPGLVAAILVADQAVLDRAAAARLPHAYIANRWRFTLIESDQRKCAFLREVVRETSLKAVMPVDIVADRIESTANHSKGGYADVVSARALAPLPQLLALAGPYFGIRTHGVFLKGREAAAEVEAVKGFGQWSFELVPSLTDAEARLVVVARQYDDL